MIRDKYITLQCFFRIKNTANEALISSGRFLFNQASFLFKQDNPYLLSFELWNDQLSRAVVLLHISAHGGEAISPYRATFGGIEMDASIDPQLLEVFLTNVHSFLREQGIKTIRITNSPFAYDVLIAQQVTALLLADGYTIYRSELNYHILVGNNPLEVRMHESARRRLRKCRKAGFVFREELAPDFAQVHSFIAAARKRKGFPMSLPLEGFQQLFINHPEVYRVFTILDGTTIAALTVTVRINNEILYNFYPADNEHYLTYSPTVMLTVELYNLAQREGYSMFDLGIATDNGKPNYGLMRFKKNLGAETSLRLSFEKRLDGTTAK